MSDYAHNVMIEIAEEKEETIEYWIYPVDENPRTGEYLIIGEVYLMNEGSDILKSKDEFFSFKDDCGGIYALVESIFDGESVTNTIIAYSDD